VQALARMASTLQKQIIVGALSLIENKENWTRGVLAQTREGERCSWRDVHATKFCAIGALGHTAAALIGHYGEALELAMASARIITASNDQPGWCLSSINDTEGHAVIVQMFRNALEKWEKPPKRS
jgi:hypothetical protein